MPIGGREWQPDRSGQEPVRFERAGDRDVTISELEISRHFVLETGTSGGHSFTVMRSQPKINKCVDLRCFSLGSEQSVSLLLTRIFHQNYFIEDTNSMHLKAVHSKTQNPRTPKLS